MSTLNETIGYGLEADKPAASEPGRPWFATDAGPTRDNGASWDSISDPTKEDTANKGAANGYAPLDSGSLVPLANLPTSVQSEAVNAQTGTTYTVVSGDATQLLTLSNASAVAVTLPQATGSFAAGWYADVRNKGVGDVTITPTTSTIAGGATLVLKQHQGVRIVSDGTHWQITSLSVTNLAASGPGGVVGTLPAANGGTGITSLGTGVATFLGTPSSANLAATLTDETGSGAAVFATSPTLVTPVLGTPASGTLTNCTGLPESGVTNLTSDLAAKAPLASPALTGTPTAPTPLTADDSTAIATTAYVQAQGYGTGALAKYTTSWSAQTSVTVTHGLGTKDVIVHVYDASDVRVEPESITTTSTSVVTLTFGAAFTGRVVVIG